MMHPIYPNNNIILTTSSALSVYYLAITNMFIADGVQNVINNIKH